MHDFRKIFYQKLKAEEILLKNEGALNIHERPFPNHYSGKGKGQVLMVSMQPECEPDLDKMAQQEKFIKVKRKIMLDGFQSSEKAGHHKSYH